MEIEKIKVIEVGDDSFKVSFMYKEHNLETDSLKRSTPLDEVKQVVKNTIRNWEENRADDNFEIIKKLEDKKLTI